MHDWADDQRSALASRWPDSAQRLEGLFARGVVCTTHYSGTGAAEVALAQISTHAGGIHFHSACDIDPVCQQILLGHGPRTQAEHIFGDLCGRPPVDVQKSLRACLARFQKKAHRASTPSCAFLQEAMDLLTQWRPSRADLGHCLRHGRRCPMFPQTGDKYHIEVSGVNCQPWSCAGRRLGWLDERSLPCLVLVRQILAMQPDGVCLECTPEFDFDGLCGLLPGYFGEKVMMSPTDLGLPVARRRMYMFFQRGRPNRSLSEFLSVSRRTTTLAPEAFLTANPARVHEQQRDLMASVLRRPSSTRGAAARPHGIGASTPVSAGALLSQMLRGGALQRYLGHRRQVLLKLGDFRGCCIVDINNTPEYRGAPKAGRIPTIMKSSILVAVFPREASDRMLLPEELPAMHGLQLPPVASDLHASQVRALVGNSMHVAQVGCFLQFVLATRG